MQELGGGARGHRPRNTKVIIQRTSEKLRLYSDGI